MEKGSGTRSGLLWEVERIINECEIKPQVLIMENVMQIHCSKNKEHFEKWLKRLEEFGYKNFWEDLNAVNYGIPQTRKRTIMVSILGNYNYKFPKKIPLELRLKDLLESNVDEKYYLSEKMINYISANNEKWTGNNEEALINKELASTINTAEGNRRCDASNYVSDELPDNYDLKRYQKVKVDLKRGYPCEIKEEQCDSTDVDVIGNYSKSNFNQTSIVGKNGVAPTVTENHGQVTAITEVKVTVAVAKTKRIGGLYDKNKEKHHAGSIYDKEYCAPTLDCSSNDGNRQPMIVENSCLRIRKLTPKECGRLMGVKDEDIELILAHQSNSSGYHLFGDSIVVNVLMAVFGELLDKNWREYFNPQTWWKK